MNWTIFFLMLPHLKPKCINYFWPELYRGIDVLRVASLLIICVMLFRKKKLPSPPSILLGLLESWICFVTLITHGDIVETCSLAVSVMAIVLLVDMYSDQMEQVIPSLMLNYEWIVYVNLISVLKSPKHGLVYDSTQGWVAIYFFGSDNWFMYLFIPTLCLALIYLRMNITESISVHKTALFRSVCLIAACYITILICWPVTTMMAMIVFAAVLLASRIPGVKRCVSYPVILLGGIGANLLVSVFRIMNTVPFIASFIQNTLGKTITFSGRTEIWDTYKTPILDNIWMGIGTPKEGYSVGELVMDHMHNEILDLLAQGGIPALLLFASVLLVVSSPLTVYRNTPAARIMVAGMAALLVMCIPEVCRHGSIFLLFPLAWHVPQIESFCSKSEA